MDEETEKVKENIFKNLDFLKKRIPELMAENERLRLLLDKHQIIY